MPSVTHESLVDLFRDCPALAPELLRHVGTRLPDGTTPRITSAELVDLDAAEYRADVVIRLDKANDEPARAIIVEVQLDRDSRKRRSWPLYVAGVHARLGCLATLLVVTIDDGIAAWCGQPIRLDTHGSAIHPVVIGPKRLPWITDFQQAHTLPELAVLSAAARGNERDGAEIALAALSACQQLDSFRSIRYADFIIASLSQAARITLEKLMSLHKYQFQSEFAKKYVKQGRDEGRDEGYVEGQRQLLRSLLEKRFGALPDEVARRVNAANVEQLNAWGENFVFAQTLDAVFDGQ